jgi:hypothetical protein
VNGNVMQGETIPVRITTAHRATMEGELDNGDITFKNFREEGGGAGART